MSSEGGYKMLNEAMLAGHYSRQLFSKNLQEVFEFGVRRKIFSPNDTQETASKRIGLLAVRDKKRIIKEMEKRFKFSYPNSSYAPTLQEVEGYSTQQITVPSQLRQAVRTGFEVNVPYSVNYNFLGSQFIELEFEEPTLADPNYVAPANTEVRFWNTSRPGIRSFPEIQINSDAAEFDKYQDYDVLKYENDSLPSNISRLWYELMGEDLGQDAQVYNVSESTHQVIRFKNGYQTAKAAPGRLLMHVPLLFAHNRNLNDKLNMAIFNKRTINIKGSIAPSRHIVRAALFSTVSVETAPIELEVAPLKIRKCTLLNLVSAVNDVMFALNLGLYYNKLYDYTKHERYSISNKKDGLKLRGTGEVLQMAVMARPKSYSEDFDKWIELTPVQSECHAVPIVVDDPVNPGMKKLAIGSAKVYKQVSPFKSISLYNNGVNILTDGTKDGSGDPALWHKIDPFIKALKYPDYFVRRSGMIYFNFNPHVNSKQIGCMFNMGKLKDSILNYELNHMRYLSSVIFLITISWLAILLLRI
jgi:hypothetical protein